jgi:GGDEF domain-containing protein
MSHQVFLYAQFRGIERFVSGAATNGELADRSYWLALISEITPRECLAGLGLSPLLVGYSGGGEFLLVLPEPAVPAAEAYLQAVRAELHAMAEVDLIWAATENLGEWPVIWRRLSEGLRRKKQTPLAASGAAAFAPRESKPGAQPVWSGATAKITANVFWNAGNPLALHPEAGDRSAPVLHGPDALGVLAPPVDPAALARTANGKRAWGLLRCDIDHALARLNKAESDEAFRYLAVLYKSLVVGELERVVAMPAHQGRVAVVYSGGDDFAVAGAWDALLGVATEFHRVFRLFAADLPGGADVGEGATLSAAITIASAGESLPEIWRANAESLESVKSSGRNSIALFGRILDWPALKDAEALKARMRKLRESFRCPPEVFNELEDFYGVRGAAGNLGSIRSRRRERAIDKPWRFHGRLRRLAGERSGGEFDRQWRNFMEALIGEASGQRQLRPAGKVALDWARLESGWRG